VEDEYGLNSRSLEPYDLQSGSFLTPARVGPDEVSLQDKSL